jgi:hypothetical protein
MEPNANQFKQAGENSLILQGNHPAGEKDARTGNTLGDEDDGRQLCEGDFQATDPWQMVLDNTPPRDFSPSTHGLPTSAEFHNSNDVGALPDYLNNNEPFDMQALGLDDPVNGYPTRSFDALPNLGDGSSRFAGTDLAFTQPQLGLDAQFGTHHFNNNWHAAHPSLPVSQSNFGKDLQYNRDPFSPSYTTQQRSPVDIQDQGIGLFQNGYPDVPDYNTSLAVTQVTQQGDTKAGAQPNLPPKRRPGRPQGGSLPEHELMTRIPAQYSGIAYSAQANSSLTTLVNSPADQHQNHGFGENPPKATGRRKKQNQSIAPKTPAKQTTISTNTTAFMTIHADMTSEELREAQDYNQRMQLQKTQNDRDRNNMSAKRGRYRRMACTVAIMDEVYRLKLEVQRAHEELHSEKILKASLTRQLEVAGVRPALPPTPAATGPIGDGTILGTLALQQGFSGNHNYSNALTLPPLPTVGQIYGPDGNGKFHLPTDHLALDDSWCQRAENTRKELLVDMPEKIAALEGGCLEEMQSVIDKGNKIRTMLADHESKRGMLQEEPDWDGQGLSSTPGLSKKTIGKRKTRTVSDELEEEDGGGALRRSARKSVRYN